MFAPPTILRNASRAQSQGPYVFLGGSLVLDALHLLPRDVHRASELLGLEHPAFHHILNRRTSEAQILGRFRYGDFLAVFVFHPNNTSPPGKDWGRDTPEGYLGPGCTLYVLASLRALAAEVKRLLERLLACIGIDNLYFHADPAVVARVRVILVVGCCVEGIAGWRHTALVHSDSSFPVGRSPGAPPTLAGLNG
jgi:hypothetical protein